MDTKKQPLLITLLLILPTLILAVAIITAKRGPKVLPPTGIQKERMTAWKDQPFVPLTNGAVTRDIVGDFDFRFNARCSAEEMESLTNSVVHFVDAFSLGTFDAYKQFRIPVDNFAFEPNLEEVISKQFHLTMAEIEAQRDVVWRRYWASAIGNRYSNYWVGISPTNCEVVVEHTASPSNDLRYAITQGSPYFTFESVTDLSLLANRLCRPTTLQSLAAHVLKELPNETRRYLERYQGGIDVAGQKGVVAGFNAVIESGPLYSPDLFRGVKLSSDTLQLLAQQPEGKDLVRLNRLLLVDSFPDALCRRAMVENVGISFMRPSIFLKPSRSEVLRAQGSTEIATIRLLPQPNPTRPIYPVYLRLYWCQAGKVWLPEQIIAAYARPDRNGDLFF